MNGAKCLVTGVILRETNGGECRNGDLFSLGNVYIVNANPYVFQPLEYNAEALIVNYDAPDTYFERRDVFIFGPDQLRLSPAVKQYIAKGALR